MRALRRRLIGTGLIVVAVAGLSACGGDGGAAQKDAVRLNQLGMIASHNSYHLEPPRVILDTMNSIIQSDPVKWSEYKNFVQSAEYSVRPLSEQFDLGLRNVEIDAWADTKGGLFSHRAASSLFNQPFDDGVDELKSPGFKVLHAPEVDFMSTCWTLKSCLGQISAWSKANPGHLPLIVDIEAKDDDIPDPLNLGFAVPEKIGGAQLDALDAEILAVFDRSSIVTPDDVRGSRKTLEEAVLKDGWPKVDDMRGKVLFLLLDQGAKRQAYAASAPSLQGRVMFTTSEPGSADAAFVQVTDPTNAVSRISEMVKAGYIVRTMADAETLEARQGNTARRDAAIASDAQLIATDFFQPIPAIGGSYRVVFEGGTYVRCNPLTANKACSSFLSAGAE
jgi:hypothetical protein